MILLDWIVYECLSLRLASVNADITPPFDHNQLVHLGTNAM